MANTLFKVRHKDEGTIYIWDIDEVLEEINRDRSDTWTKYTATDNLPDALSEWTDWEVLEEK